MPFATLGLPPVVVKGARAAGYIEPTPIQRKAIPIILQGNDIIAAAASGTGKTAAYLLPILTRLLDGPRRLRCIILVPARELAAKVETGARDFARFTDLRITVVHPGAPLAPVEKSLRSLSRSSYPPLESLCIMFPATCSDQPSPEASAPYSMSVTRASRHRLRSSSSTTNISPSWKSSP